MKKFLALTLLIATLALLGCGSDTNIVPATSEPTAAPAVTSTAEPVTVEITTPEPVITSGEPTLSELPDGFTVDSAYTSKLIGDNTVFAFTDTEGEVQYRAYASYHIYYNDEIKETVGGLYPITVTENESGAAIELKEGAKAVELENEPFGKCVPSEVLEGTRIRSSFTKAEKTGLYSNGDSYIVYGAFIGSEPEFYPADAEGEMIAGSLPYEGEVIIPAYYPTDAPKTDGKYLLVVYINTQSVVAYHAENGEWVQVRAMICSTGRSAKYYPTPHGNFTIPETYRYKKLGLREGDYWYGQYASRITTNYLFHSTPIWEQAGRDYNVGKTMVKLSQYEMLGQPASGGCVRLTVIDAKWIYDNCGVGTAVRIGDWDGPTVAKPPAIIYEEPYMTGEDMGWDPTDPDPENPYRAIYGELD